MASNDSDEPQRGRARGVIGRLIEGAINGGLVGGASSAIGGPGAAATGAAGGALVGAIAGVADALSADAELGAAETEATHDAARRVPDLAHRIEQLESFAKRVVDELEHGRKSRSHARVLEVASGLLQLVASGEATIDAFDEEQRDAVTEAIRFSLDALDDAAVPMIARLACRPVDHFFRGVCRVLVDVDATQLALLRQLFATAAVALPALLVERPVASGYIAHDGFQRIDIDHIDLESVLHEGDPRTKRWDVRWLMAHTPGNLITSERVQIGDAVVVPEHAPLASLLVGHRLARPADGYEKRVHGNAMNGFSFDDRVL